MKINESKFGKYFDKNLKKKRKFILIGLFFPISAILILKKWLYCRQFYAFVILATFVIQNASGGSFIYLPFALVIPCLLIVYLFKYNKAKVYFGT